jgi:hypothetical protein
VHASALTFVAATPRDERRRLCAVNDASFASLCECTARIYIAFRNAVSSRASQLENALARIASVSEDVARVDEERGKESGESGFHSLPLSSTVFTLFAALTPFARFTFFALSLTSVSIFSLLKRIAPHADFFPFIAPLYHLCITHSLHLLIVSSLIHFTHSLAHSPPHTSSRHSFS